MYYQMFEGDKCNFINIHTEYVNPLLCIALWREVGIRHVKFLSLAWVPHLLHFHRGKLYYWLLYPQIPILTPCSVAYIYYKYFALASYTFLLHMLDKILCSVLQSAVLKFEVLNEYLTVAKADKSSSVSTLCSNGTTCCRIIERRLDTLQVRFWI